jgi:hypothetical protein
MKSDYVENLLSLLYHTTDGDVKHFFLEAVGYLCTQSALAGLSPEELRTAANARLSAADWFCNVGHTLAAGGKDLLERAGK